MWAAGNETTLWAEIVRRLKVNEKFSFEVSRASAGRMVARLREFLLNGGFKLGQRNAYECVARAMGFANWNTMSAKWPNDDVKYPDQHLMQWAPTVIENQWEARFDHGAVLVVIPAKEFHTQAIRDVRALFAGFGENRHRNPAVWTDDAEQWPWKDDHVAVSRFRREWLKAPQDAIGHFINFREENQLFVPLATNELINLVVEASIATLNSWGFLVANGYSDAIIKLLDSDSYLSYGRSGHVRLLMWPFTEEDTGEPIDDRTWMPVLKRKLVESRDLDQQRHPLTAVSERQFRQLVAMAENAERKIQEVRAANLCLGVE
jgi:hypothetical protein